MKSVTIGVVLILLIVTVHAVATTRNGFDLSGSLIPVDKIQRGGPPRDGIPAIDRPVFVAVEEVDYLAADDRVIGVKIGGVVRAYPIKILNWHEVVNDSAGDISVLVTFCPLCNTGMVFRSSREGEFGVSGLLYNSDVLLYDRRTESLWSQILGKAVSGPSKGQSLEQLPASHTTWRDWSQRHPESLVLSTQTGYRRDYDRSPYLGYAQSPRLFFDVEYRNRAHRNKELVLGVTVDDRHKAYPFGTLQEKGSASFTDEIAGKPLTVTWSAKDNTAAAYDQQGAEIPSVIAYWFAWYAFYPGTEVLELK